MTGPRFIAKKLTCGAGAVFHDYIYRRGQQSKKYNEGKVRHMIYVKNRVTLSLALFALMLVLISGYRGSLAQDAGTSEVIFYVK